jgi:hypothetical protein
MPVDKCRERVGIVVGDERSQQFAVRRNGEITASGDASQSLERGSGRFHLVISRRAFPK